MNDLMLTILLSGLFLFLAGLVIFLLVILLKMNQTPLWILRDQMTENQLLRNQLRTSSISDLNGMNAATLPARSVSNLTPDDLPVGNEYSPSVVDLINVGELEEDDLEGIPSDDLGMMGWQEPTFTRNSDGSIEVHEPNM